MYGCYVDSLEYEWMNIKNRDLARVGWGKCFWSNLLLLRINLWKIPTNLHVQECFYGDIIAKWKLICRKDTKSEVLYCIRFIGTCITILTNNLLNIQANPTSRSPICNKTYSKRFFSSSFKTIIELGILYLSKSWSWFSSSVDFVFLVKIFHRP